MSLHILAAAHLIYPDTSVDPRGVPTIVSAPPPARHHNLFAIMPDGPYPCGDESGFLLSDGTFATREQAQPIAIAAGQVLDLAKLRGDQLFSEDLW